MKKKHQAAAIAQRLAARFLEAGNYVFSSPLSPRALANVLPAAAEVPAVDRHFEGVGFAGLSVQSVGYEEGVDEPRVHVYVTKGPRKLEKELPGESDVRIEINRVGRVVVRPETAAAATNHGNVFLRNGRIACGSSCAPSGEFYAGTLGALSRKKGGGTLYVLSNNHVLAAGNHVPVGMPILSPSTIDARPGLVAPGEVCRHEDICELRSGVPTLVTPQREDVAIARVTDPGKVSSWQGDTHDGFDTPHVVEELRSGLRVKKFGRTTGLTTGTIEALVLPFPLPYNCRYFAATVWFQDVWTVRADPGQAFALPGDSGSLTVTEAGDAALGLVFACASQGQYGYIIPMKHIISLFGSLTLVSDHNV